MLFVWYDCKVDDDCSSGYACVNYDCSRKCSTESGAVCDGYKGSNCYYSSPGSGWVYEPGGNAYCYYMSGGSYPFCYCLECKTSGKCDADDDCCEGYGCVDGSCVALAGWGGSCTSNDYCQAGLHCNDGHCCCDGSNTHSACSGNVQYWDSSKGKCRDRGECGSGYTPCDGVTPWETIAGVTAAPGSCSEQYDPYQGYLACCVRSVDGVYDEEWVKVELVDV